MKGLNTMATIRVEKSKDYTIMCNHHLKDLNLSLKAKGLMSLVLSLPDGWNYSIKGLISICKESRDAVSNALKELETYNYLVRTRLQDEVTGRFSYEYVFYEILYSGFGHTVKRHAENQPQLNTNNKELNNKDKTDKINNPLKLRSKKVP